MRNLLPKLSTIQKQEVKEELQHQKPLTTTKVKKKFLKPLKSVANLVKSHKPPKVKKHHKLKPHRQPNHLVNNWIF